MLPKTILQKNVVKASRRLPKLTQAQIKWAYANCVDHIGRRTAKGVITCSHCGHTWQGESHLIDTLGIDKCPECNVKLTIETSRKRVFTDCQYMTILTACEGFQVFRTIMIKCRTEMGSKAQEQHSEVMQRWIAPNGKYATLAKLRQTMGTCYCDLWIFGTPLELRTETDVYNRIPIGEMYPKMNIIPELTQRGFKGEYHGIRPFDLFTALLSNNKAETLLKIGQFDLLKYFNYNDFKTIDKYWPSLRICFRNKYSITNVSDWCDYIDMLRFCGRDLTNAKFVCPEDFKAQHDKYMEKREEYRKAQRKIEEQKRKEQQAEWQRRERLRKAKEIADFQKNKARFFGLQFTDGLITVRALESIEDYKEEGKAMHHCVGGYYTRKDSLVLSAGLVGKRLETVEVSLSKLDVIQCRGVCNQESEYHEQILKLVRDNMLQIEKRLTA